MSGAAPGPRPDHEAIRELLGVYALDAVERDEAELVGRHLEVCPRCRSEVQEHREVAGLLGYAGQEAPAGLWDRIAASTHEPPPALRLQRVPEGPGLPSPGGVVVDLAAGAARARTAGRGARPVPVWARAVAAAAAVALVAVIGVQELRLDHRTSTLAADMGGGQATMHLVDQALAVPGARRVVLAPVGTDATLDAVILPGGQGYLYHSTLSPLPASQTYQLWGITSSQPVSYGLLGPAPASVVPFRAGPGLQALAVTAEVAGGVTRSSHAPVAAGGVVPAL